jgi:hypothetical protein
MTIRATVSALVRSLGELSAEQAVLAETARQLAAVMDRDSASYALPGMSRELRAVITELTTAPGARGLVDDDLDDELTRLFYRGGGS